MAYVVEQTGRVAKTHSGLRSEFARVARQETRIDPAFVRFLARAYTLKSAADYGADPGASVSPDQANEATAIAGRLIDIITELIK